MKWPDFHEVDPIKLEKKKEWVIRNFGLVYSLVSSDVPFLLTDV